MFLSGPPDEKLRMPQGCAGGRVGAVPGAAATGKCPKPRHPWRRPRVRLRLSCSRQSPSALRTPVTNSPEQMHPPHQVRSLALCFVIWTHRNHMCFTDVCLCGLRKKCTMSHMRHLTRRTVNENTVKVTYI